VSASTETAATWDCECRIRRRDGSLRWIWIRGRTFEEENGQPRRMAGTVADISDRKRIEEELRHARSRLEAALAAGAIATWMWDIPNDRMFADEALARLFGLDSADARGGLLDRYKESIHPDDRDRVTAVLGRAVETGEDYEADYRIVQPDGSVRWVVARGRAERDVTGRPVRMPGVLVDITERKRLEEALRDTDRRKDEFLATLAHELRNPLAPIRNSLQILKMPRVDAAMAKRTRDIMERQVQHLVRLVDDLLDVSRVMRGKIELRKERVELATVVARAVETAQPLIEVQGHELDISLPAESLLLHADPVRLAQVVGNLLTNAAKYTEPGGHIWLSAQRDGDAAVLRVRDDGIGIAASMLPHVFELFVQVDHASTRSQGGLGIGLTLVKNLVDLHGGTVEARSRGLGHGSEFVVRLPLTLPAHHGVDDDVRGEPAHAVMPTGHRVLVVDDNDDAAMSLALVLELKGHVVRVVHDGVSALEAVRTFSPALILLDLGMPEMDGFEVARRIRRMPAAADTVIAALTGWGQKEDRRRTAEAGFDHHLVKPVEPKTLEGLLAGLTAVSAEREGREAAEHSANE
jgi:PAS domain S-box-containing protein